MWANEFAWWSLSIKRWKELRVWGPWALMDTEESFALLFCPWFSPAKLRKQIRIYEQFWFPFRLFNLIAIFNVRKHQHYWSGKPFLFSRGSSGPRIKHVLYLCCLLCELQRKASLQFLGKTEPQNYFTYFLTHQR